MNPRNLFAELKRRNVIRAAILLCRRRLGARAGHLSTEPIGRRTGMGDALVSGRCSNRFPVLYRVRLVL
jgi:hypothetical protein